MHVIIALLAIGLIKNLKQSVTNENLEKRVDQVLIFREQRIKCIKFGTKYSRMDQVKLVKDSL